MNYTHLFEKPSNFKVVLKDTVRKNIYYGLDEYDAKYLKIVQHRYNCINDLFGLPSNVKMEVAAFYWNPEVQKFVLDVQNRLIVQLNKLEKLEEVAVGTRV